MTRSSYGRAALVLIALLATFAVVSIGYRRPADIADKGTLAAAPAALVPDPVEIVEVQVQRGATLDNILGDLGMARQQIAELLTPAAEVYNLRRVRAGNRCRLERRADGTIRSFRYEIDPERYLLVASVAGGYSAAVKVCQLETVVEEVAGVISSSLSVALREQGETDELAINLSEIFQWDIDFNSDIQEGDYFKVIVKKSYLDGKLIKYGHIEAAEFRNGRRTLQAIRFEDPSGRVDYYSGDGKSLRKAFLRSPFRFNPRISSRFTHSRFHPVLKKSRPHLGIDYAAPAGTPVYAAADGVVRFAGFKGGYGRFVEIDHPGRLVTTYGHLSAFSPGIHAGMRVRQNEMIGRVGSSGLATGPHLDYRVMRAGRFVNPIRLQQIPKADPIKAAYREAFLRKRDSLQSRLAAISVPSVDRAIPAAGL